MFFVPINIKMFEICPPKFLVFFSSKKLKPITFWPERRLMYSNLRVTLSLISMIVIGMGNFWEFKTITKYREKKPQKLWIPFSQPLSFLTFFIFSIHQDNLRDWWIRKLGYWVSRRHLIMIEHWKWYS